MKRTIVLFYLAFLTMGGAVPLEAHAFLRKAEPGVGSTVKSSPDEVRIQFSEAVEPAFSKIQVFNAKGKEVDKGDAHVDPADRTRLAVSLPSLAPGAYTVIWRVVSLDTHVTNGKFTFTVSR